MKRAWLCALVILLLALGAAAATAEAAALPPAIAFDAAEAPYPGVWVPFEDGFQLYLPETWRAFDLTDEQRAAGLFYRAGGDGIGVAVGYAPADGLVTADELEADYRGAGFSQVRRQVLNGIEAVSFARPEEGYRGAAFFNPIYPGYVMTVYATPLDAQGTTGQAILRSVSPYPAQTEGE